MNYEKTGERRPSPQIAPEAPSRTTTENRYWIRFLPGFIQGRMSGRHNLQAILGNSTWLFMDKIVRMGVGLIVGVWVARYLGPGRFGLLNYAMAFTSLFGALATLGLDGIVVRELVRDPENKDVILGSAFALKLAGGLTTLAIVVIAVSIMRPGEKLTLWLMAILSAGFIFQSLNVIDLYFQSRVQSRYTIYATNSAFILMTIVKVGLLLAAAPLIAFAWATTGELALTSIFLLVVYRANRLKIWTWRPKMPEMRQLLWAGWPLVMSGISIMISTRVDQVIIGQTLNDKQVGIYSAAARIAEIWYFIPLGIAASTFPLLVESKKQSETLYYQRLQQLYNTLVMVAIVFALIMTFLARPIVGLLYGHAYLGAARVLSILIWSGVTVSFGCAWSNWMLLENRTGMMFVVQVSTAAINLVLNLILIPRFGIVGSAYATLISYWVGPIGIFTLVKSQHKALAMIARAVFPLWLFAGRTGNVPPA